MPAQRDLPLWRGNTETVPIRLKTRSGAVTTPVNLTGSTLIFRATWAGGGLLRSELVITNAAQGEAELRLTVADTRSLPPTGLVSYEIERQIGGTQKTVLFGRVSVGGGTNDD